MTSDLSDIATRPTYQDRVQPWLDACFGREIAIDKTERNHRFLEEALETVQAGGCSASEAHQLVDYVYGRPVGDLHQEVGGVMNTLAALCLAHGLDMHKCGEVELARVWTKVEKIRAKQAAKPKHSPLPEAPSPCNSTDVVSHDGALDALVKFAKTVIQQECWEGGESGGEYQELALKLGLLTATTFDPKVHGEAEYDAEPGGEWFVFAGPLAPHVAPETPVERDGGAS